jgi:phosphohistidine phosphatase SixA
MSLYLVHHVDALTAEQDPRRPISESGRHEAARLGDRFLGIGVLPERILHSEKQWTIDTAQRIADRLGVPERAAMAHYSINTGDPIAPFLAEVEATGGDLMMCGHIDFLMRAASYLVCGDETRPVVAFRPGTGTAVCLQRDGLQWVVAFVWRQDHAPG